MHQPEPPILLEMRNLRVEAAGKTGVVELVRGVNLTLRRGEVLGLIGESGAGKSTIGLAALAYARGGCRISGGEVLLEGLDLLALPGSALRNFRGGRVAYVAQSAAAAFNPSRRIIDQYVEAARLHGRNDTANIRREAISRYRSLRLPDPETIGQRYPHELSGGQLQRAMVAMAMAASPDLIVFDEPTTALDVTTQREVLIAIRDLISQEHIGGLFISHDLAVVSQMADRIMVLRNGVVVEEGESQELMANPREAYTRALLSALSHHRRSHDTSEAVLDVRALDAGYGAAVRILQEVDLRVARGSVTAIVGESGSGKSTLARVIAGLLTPQAGSITFEGKPLPHTLGRRDRESLWRIQYVHQNPDAALNPSHTVQELLERVVVLRDGLRGSQLRERIRELLAMTELGEQLLPRRPSQLSGGQKQRVCIARAIAARPSLLICDEVTSSLDPLVARGIIDLLGKLQAELGVSYMFITHDLSIVESIADEVVVMHKGRVVETGATSQVLGYPESDYTAALIAAVPRFDRNWLQ